LVTLQLKYIRGDKIKAGKEIACLVFMYRIRDGWVWLGFGRWRRHVDDSLKEDIR
jgi:hypothetical protein